MKKTNNKKSSPYSSAKIVVPIVVQLIKPKSVVDIGCGDGSWLKAVSELGIKDILGIDLNYLDNRRMKISRKHFLDFDLTKPLNLNRHYDLTISLEVGEHIPEKYAKIYIDTLTRHSFAVLFSAAIPHQQGLNHINEQWPEYWQKLFFKKGFIAVDIFREKIWESHKVEWWYRQNIMLYVKKDKVHDYIVLEQGRIHLSIVHPECYENLYYNYPGLRALIKRIFWKYFG